MCIFNHHANKYLWLFSKSGTSVGNWLSCVMKYKHPMETLCYSSFSKETNSTQFSKIFSLQDDQLEGQN